MIVNKSIRKRVGLLTAVMLLLPNFFTPVYADDGRIVGDVAVSDLEIYYPDYTSDELLVIAKMMLEEQQYQFSPTAESVFFDYIQKRRTQPLFANARSVRNALDRARMRQANRNFDSGGRILTKLDLVTITDQDIKQSSIFN